MCSCIHTGGGLHVAEDELETVGPEDGIPARAICDDVHQNANANVKKVDVNSKVKA